MALTNCWSACPYPGGPIPRISIQDRRPWTRRFTMSENASDRPKPESKLRDALAGVGFHHLSEGWTYKQFRAVCEQLGEIYHEAEVRLGASRPRNYQLPDAIDFHNDHASAEIVAWYCVETEPDGGAMRLLDLAPAASRLTPDQRDALTRIGVEDNAVWGGRAPVPLALKSDGGLRFHYVPWLPMYPEDTEARWALEAFRLAVRDMIHGRAVKNVEALAVDAWAFDLIKLKRRVRRRSRSISRPATPSSSTTIGSLTAGEPYLLRAHVT